MTLQCSAVEYVSLTWLSPCGPLQTPYSVPRHNLGCWGRLGFKIYFCEKLFPVFFVISRRGVVISMLMGKYVKYLLSHFIHVGINMDLSLDQWRLLLQICTIFLFSSFICLNSIKLLWQLHPINLYKIRWNKYLERM